jgi:hypothetical protein
MSTIGGPGGIGGPKGPKGPDGVGDVGDIGDVGDVGETDAAAPASVTESRSAAGAADVEALAADIAAGRLTPHEAIDRLVEATAGPELDAAERAELREMLTDMVANDPHLGRLVGRI